MHCPPRAITAFGFLIVAACTQQPAAKMDWEVFGLSEVLQTSIIYETEDALTDIDTDNGSLLAAVNQTRSRIDLLEYDATNSTLDPSVSVKLPLAPDETVVRCEVIAGEIVVISERNVWRYGLLDRRVKARVRTFLPLADICPLDTGGVVVTEYPVLNGESLVWLYKDLSFRKRRSVLRFTEDVRKSPQIYELLVTRISGNGVDQLGLIALGFRGQIAAFGSEGILGGFRDLVSELHKTRVVTPPRVGNQELRMYIMDLCGWKDGALLLAKSNLTGKPVVIETDGHGNPRNGAWFDMPEGTIASSIAAMSADNSVFVLLRDETSRVVQLYR